MVLEASIYHISLSIIERFWNVCCTYLLWGLVSGLFVFTNVNHFFHSHGLFYVIYRNGSIGNHPVLQDVRGGCKVDWLLFTEVSGVDNV